MSGQTSRDPSNPYPATKPNDPGEELVAKVIEYYRNHRGQFSSTEATNIGTAVTNILNGTNKV
jgi:hypothetical protein